MGAIESKDQYDASALFCHPECQSRCDRFGSGEHYQVAFGVVEDPVIVNSRPGSSIPQWPLSPQRAQPMMSRQVAQPTKMEPDKVETVVETVAVTPEFDSEDKPTPTPREEATNQSTTDESETVDDCVAPTSESDSDEKLAATPRDETMSATDESETVDECVAATSESDYDERLAATPRAETVSDVDEALVADWSILSESQEIEETCVENPKVVTHGGSEGMLRGVMTCHNASTEQLRSAIAAVEALVGEARRELENKQLRERRAAHEQLGSAIDKGDEELLEAALVMAQKAELDSEDIKSGDDALQALRSRTEEQKAADTARKLEVKKKKEAFLLVKRDDPVLLQGLLDGFGEGMPWIEWRDYAGRTLWRYAQEQKAEQVQLLLASKAPKYRQSLEVWTEAKVCSPAPRTDSVATTCASESSDPTIDPMDSVAACCDSSSVTTTSPAQALQETTEPSAPEDLSKLKAEALRAVVQDDVATLDRVLTLVPKETWTAWQNKAGKDLLKLSEERGSGQTQASLLKAMGLVKELEKDTFADGEYVWVYNVGDVQGRQAKVLGHVPKQADQILIQYWDADEAVHVDRAMVRKAYHNHS